jgi:predicted RND superfamily exporter protein
MVGVKADYAAARSLSDSVTSKDPSSIILVTALAVLLTIYVALRLRRFTITLATAVIMVMALYAGIGTVCYTNQPITLFVAQVMPLLVMTFGLDNTFALVDAETKVPRTVTSVEARIGMAMKEVGPDILITSACQIGAFSVGIATSVPALSNFCEVAALTIMYLFLFQITILIAVLTLDNKRIQENKRGLLCYLKT